MTVLVSLKQELRACLTQDNALSGSYLRTALLTYCVLTCPVGGPTQVEAGSIASYKSSLSWIGVARPVVMVRVRVSVRVRV